MDWETGRMTHIEDVLNKIGQDEKRPVWFTWTDSNHKIWENLVIIGNYAKPSKEHLESELARYQAEHDAQAYARSRKAEYPTIEECVHAMLDGGLDELQAKRQVVKQKYPKE
jgi:hypothetical protein